MSVERPSSRGGSQGAGFPRLLAAAIAARRPLVNSGVTDAVRLFGGSADGIDGIFVDRYGPGCVLSLYEGRAPSAFDIDSAAQAILNAAGPLGVTSVYFKPFARDRSKLGGEGPAVLSDPSPIAGEPLPDAVTIHEHGLAYEARLHDGFSVGLFLDQRENRAHLARWIARRPASRPAQRTSAREPTSPRAPRVAKGWSVEKPAAAPDRQDPDTSLPAPPPRGPEPTGPRVLNTFAYTCAFSVACAKAGAATTSVDVSPKYLDWGKRNFALSGLDPLVHRFARMDTFEFFQYARKKGLSYELIILDPPSFSAPNKKRKIPAWSSTQHYSRLVSEAAELLAPGGAIFASTNTRELCVPGKLDREIEKGLGRAPSYLRLPPPPLDFAREQERFAAKFFTVS